MNYGILDLVRAGILGVLCFSARTVEAQDWPQWTGPDHSGNQYVETTGLPADFDPGTIKPGTHDIDLNTTRNVQWVARLGNDTFGNPVISNGRVLVGTGTDGENGHSLLCFDEATGALLWKLNDPRPAFGWNYSLGVTSPAVIEGDHIYVFMPYGELLSLTEAINSAHVEIGPAALHPIEIIPARVTGLWSYDLRKELAVYPRNPWVHASGAPLSLGQFVYLNTMNGKEAGRPEYSAVLAPNAPSLVAIDRQTGELAGKDDAGIGPRILHGSWSSPSTGRVNGRQLIFLGGGDGYCYAFDALPVREGHRNLLKTVWQADCNPPDYKTQNGKSIRYRDSQGPSEIIATPVFWRNRVYVSTGQDREADGVGNLVCIDATQTGDITTSGILWRNKTIHRTRSTVSITPEGLLFLTDSMGFLHCLDAETGETYWTHDFKSQMQGNASTLAADGKLYVGDEDGDFRIFAAVKEKRLLWEVNMGAPISTTPVVANGVLFIATSAHLYAIAEKATAAR
jgi:outer membrane protein assembly factor BamB